MTILRYLLPIPSSSTSRYAIATSSVAQPNQWRNQNSDTRNKMVFRNRKNNEKSIFTAFNQKSYCQSYRKPMSIDRWIIRRTVPSMYFKKIICMHFISTLIVCSCIFNETFCLTSKAWLELTAELPGSINVECMLHLFSSVISSHFHEARVYSTCERELDCSLQRMCVTAHS